MIVGRDLLSDRTWEYTYHSQHPDETCDNGADDDQDLLRDCDDPDCAWHPDCR